MITLAGLGRADRRRVEARLAELRELEKEMRRPGLLPGSAEPVPLHRNRMTSNSIVPITNNSTTLSTEKRTAP